jgi:hypothetical protein
MQSKLIATWPNLIGQVRGIDVVLAKHNHQNSIGGGTIVWKIHTKFILSLVMSFFYFIVIFYFS